MEGERKSFSDKQKLKEFVTKKPVLQEMLKELISGGKRRPKIGKNITYFHDKRVTDTNAQKRG